MPDNIVQLFGKYQDYIEARQDRETLPTFAEWRRECEEEEAEAVRVTVEEVPR